MNLNTEIIDAVNEGLIPKDDLIVALLRVIGPTDLRDIIEAYDWTNLLKNGDQLPVYKRRALNVDDVNWNNDMEDNEDD